MRPDARLPQPRVLPLRRRERRGEISAATRAHIQAQLLARAADRGVRRIRLGLQFARASSAAPRSRAARAASSGSSKAAISRQRGAGALSSRLRERSARS